MDILNHDKHTTFYDYLRLDILFYFGDMFIPEADLEGLEGDKLQALIDKNMKSDWLEMREPTPAEKKQMVGFTNVHVNKYPRLPPGSIRPFWAGRPPA